MIRMTIQIAAAMVFTAGLLAVAGCSSTETAENDGSTLTTAPGQQLEPRMFYGKWDLDGERTNLANSQDNVADDIVKDILGAGWTFEPNGVFRRDRTVGEDLGTWEIQGADTLVITVGNEPGQSYEASFRSGFMYLKDAAGAWKVMERNKFFGF